LLQIWPQPHAGERWWQAVETSREAAAAVQAA